MKNITETRENRGSNLADFVVGAEGEKTDVKGPLYNVGFEGNKSDVKKGVSRAISMGYRIGRGLLEVGSAVVEGMVDDYKKFERNEARKFNKYLESQGGQGR